MTVVYLSLGSNLGGRRQYISNAVACLGESPWLSELKLSSIIETAAVGGPVQGDFLNAVLQCKCSCSAHELLGLVNDVEHLLGRQRAGKNHPRTIDIDILLFGEEQHQHPDLVIPHPRMHSRQFVLEPLAEFLPDIVAYANSEN